jgi:hypothetical protein
MSSSRPTNYSTVIPASKTAAECQQLLADAGASSVAVHYDNREPSGLSFRLDTPHGPRAFTLPVDVAGAAAVLALMLRDNPPRGLSRAQLEKMATPKHAANVAWRVARDWLEATPALVSAGMASITQAMLPYVHVDAEQTLWEAYREREQAAIEAGGQS